MKDDIAMEDSEYCIDDEIADLVAEMVITNESKAIAFLCGLLIGVVESVSERQGHNPNAKMELVGCNRTITIDAYQSEGGL